VVILTFTPFLCFFAKNASIDPLPFLVGEFVAANTWSMALLIGNPTNICLCTAGNVDFLAYLQVMWLPTLLSGLTSFAVLYLMFRKRLQKPMEQGEDDPKLADVPAVVTAICHLGVCILLLVFSNFLAMPMWLITLVCFASLYVSMTVYFLARKKGLRMITDSFRRAPWEIIPFVLSMFVIVLALNKCGFTGLIANAFSKGDSIFVYGLTSFLSANVFNNIPMSVLFSDVLSLSGLVGREYFGALYASIIGSNIGAYLSPVGALAGIMWLSILKKNGHPLSFLHFMKYGVIISIPIMILALLTLHVSILFI
jgi:arsenical pump membrane protein